MDEKSTMIRINDSTRTVLRTVRSELSLATNEPLMSDDATILKLIEDWRRLNATFEDLVRHAQSQAVKPF